MPPPPKTYAPLSRSDLLEALKWWHGYMSICDDQSLECWTEFMGERGAEVIALALAAIDRLGPKQVRGPYGQRMLGQTQAKIVEAITDHGPLTVSEIAAAIGGNYQNTRRMLPVLEARGLIAKRHDPIKAAQVWVAPGAASSPQLAAPVSTPATEISQQSTDSAAVPAIVQLPERPPLPRIKRCKQCEDQCWRRPRTGQCACGRLFAPETVSVELGNAKDFSPFDPAE